MAPSLPGLAVGFLSLVLASTLASTAAAAAAATPHRGRPVATGVSTVPTTGFRWFTITARDGVVLRANVIEPTTPGRHPAVVFVNSWGLDDTEYLAQALRLGRRGYVVLSYTTRGFWGSGGRIDTAGPADIADMSTVLDWLVANTSADPARIGAAGISYGSGISLIASAFDRRIRAVVAMSTWTDLGYSLYGAQTRRPQAAWLLRGAAALFGRPSAELNRMLDDYFAGRNLGPVLEWAKVRSASTYVDAINRNRPAIMLASTYGESIFPPNQVVGFFNRLTGPKRLELAAGDHFVAEIAGLLGLPSYLWDNVVRWFDQHLAGVDTGIAAEPRVQLRRLGWGGVEGYADWGDVAGSTRRYGLGAVRPLDGTGPLAAPPPLGAWSRTIWAGFDTTANAGVALLANGLSALTGIPATVWLPSVNRLNSGVWAGDPLPSGVRLRGITTLHLTLTSAPARGTAVGYLYDLDALGMGRLIAYTPVSWLSRTDAIVAEFQVTAYDVPPGHRLALAVDTKDPLYLDANTAGSRLAFGSTSWLDVPLR